MIQQEVNSILEAEKVAQEMITAAEAEANSIAISTTKSVQIVDKQAAETRKQYIISSTTSANSQAHTQAEQMVAEGKSSVDSELEKYSVNSYKAVAYVMEQIL